jgi:hypothetical protein
VFPDIPSLIWFRKLAIDVSTYFGSFCVPGSSSQYIIRSTSTLVNECPGVPLAWNPDDPLAVFTKYPWTRHGIKDNPLGFRFPTANYDGDNITGFDIRSVTCTGRSNNGDACSPCRKLIPKIENLRQLSQQPPGRLDYQYQTHDQLTQSHRSKNQIIQDLKLTVNQF